MNEMHNIKPCRNDNDDESVVCLCRMSPWRGGELETEYRASQESRARLAVSTFNDKDS